MLCGQDFLCEFGRTVNGDARSVEARDRFLAGLRRASESQDEREQVYAAHSRIVSQLFYAEARRKDRVRVGKCCRRSSPLYMSMRGTVRRARPAVAIDLRAFGWDRALIATLRHSTLPWFDGFAAEISLDATPVADAGELGARDRLSLVAQFAAHEALLQFAGFSDADYDAAEWAVVRKRGNDCRLVRVATRGMAEEAPPALMIQQFAEANGAPPLESLRQSWGRAESVYIEIESRLRGDAAADLRWMRRAACGEIASPGPDALNDIVRGTARVFAAMRLRAFAPQRRLAASSCWRSDAMRRRCSATPQSVRLRRSLVRWRNTARARLSKRSSSVRRGSG